MTCAHFGQDQICTQVHASFSPIRQVPNPSQGKLSDVDQLIISNEIQEMSALNWVSIRLASTWEESCESFWPPNASLDAGSTCAATSDFLGVRLVRVLQ